MYDLLVLNSLYSHQPSGDTMKERLSQLTEFDLLSTRRAEYLISKSGHGYYEHGEKSGRILAHQIGQIQ